MVQIKFQDIFRNTRQSKADIDQKMILIICSVASSDNDIVQYSNLLTFATNNIRDTIYSLFSFIHYEVWMS